VLIDQADGRLRSLGLLVKQPEELRVILPVPAGVVFLHEPFAFDLVGEPVEGRELIAVWRMFVAQLFLRRQGEPPDAGEDFQPGEQ